VRSFLLTAVYKDVAQIWEEGIANVWKRHEANAQLLWEKLDGTSRTRQADAALILVRQMNPKWSKL
jgi:aspartate aminotransferase-like enzyme